MINPYPFFGVPNFNRPYPYYCTYNSHRNFVRQPQKPISPNVCKQKEQENNSCSNSANKNNNFSSNNQNRINNSSQHNQYNKNSSFYNNNKYKTDNNFCYNKQNKNTNSSCDSNYINTDNYCSSNSVDCSEDFSNNEYFEIFGLKLYFDDLLIIALLFFLYQEDVKDTYLYISLILLLLS